MSETNESKSMAPMGSRQHSGSKLCFVTTGATAPFRGLIEAVLKPEVLVALEHLGYTHLRVQYGSAEQTFGHCLNRAISSMSETENHLIVDGVDFFPDGLQAQLKLVSQSKGLVISHAGSGSILEVMRFGVPLIVVPNTALLHNHQDQLAVALERNHYVIRGDVRDLLPAIEKSESFRQEMSQSPPLTSGRHRETKSFAAVLDETMGYMD